jgi:hypothetical protein
MGRGSKQVIKSQTVIVLGEDQNKMKQKVLELYWFNLVF